MQQENFFAVLPGNVRYNPRLPHRAVLLYALLTSLAASSGDVYASNAYLCNALGISEATVKRLLRALMNEHYITVRVTTLDPLRRRIRINDVAAAADEHGVQALYAVIPSHILSDARLSPQAKLFYAEVSAATVKGGYCGKSNAYFAKLLGVSESAVRRNLNELIAISAVRIEYEYRAKTQAIAHRHIYLSDIAEIPPQMPATPAKDVLPSNVSEENNKANKPVASRISSGVIFEPTPDTVANVPAKRLKKRRKSTSYTVQNRSSFLFRQVTSFLSPPGVIFEPHI